MRNIFEAIYKTPGDTGWFTADRFGMFIHWGLYSLPARHEWVKTYEKISEEKYLQYFKHFNPDLYNASEWARAAKRAGMKYVVITTKHHEGFCLWDSAFTDYKATNTPVRRDLIAPFVDAFRAEGLKIGFYYSLIDWHHADFTVDILHPRNGEKTAIVENGNRDMRRYAQYMRNQIRELLTNYGKIDILWFDFSYDSEESIQLHNERMPHVTGRNYELKGKGAKDWETEELIKTVRELQPDIIINDRTGVEQDIWTPEQYQPREWIRHEKTDEPVNWETSQTFSGSWGYNRDELTWKTPDMIIRILIDTVSCGGNLILNVGPTARGEFDDRALSSLSSIGDWMHYHNRAIYNCTASEFKSPDDCRYTQNGYKLYLFIFAWPLKHLFLEALAGRVEYAQFLHDGSEIIFREEIKYDDVNVGQGTKSGEIILELPAIKPNVIIPVIELFLKIEVHNLKNV